MSWIEAERIAFIDEFERQYGIRLSENDEMLEYSGKCDLGIPVIV